VQTEATQYRRELQSQRSQYHELRGRAAALEQQLRSQGEELENHRALHSMIQEDADMYETLRGRIADRMGRGGGVPTRPATGDSSPARGGAEPEWVTAVRENNDYIKEERARLQQERKLAHQDRLFTAVHGQVTELLKQSGYVNPGPELTQNVIKFVVQRGGEVFEDTGTPEDVPWLFGEWLKGQRHAEQARDTQRIAAHTADASRPTPVPAGPIVPSGPKPAPLGSAAIRDQVASFLRQHGWQENAA